MTGHHRLLQGDSSGRRPSPFKLPSNTPLCMRSPALSTYPATIALAVLAALAAAAEEPAPWRIPQSSVRLLATTRDPYVHSLMVHVPDVLFRERPSSAAAFIVDGPEVPAALVDVGGRPVAVEVFVGGRPTLRPDLPPAVLAEQGEKQIEVEVYLLKDQQPRVTLPQSARRPLRIQRFVSPLTTRPFTAKELLILEAVQPPGGDVGYLAGFGDPVLDTYRARSGRRRASRLRWSAQLRVPGSGEYRIGTDSKSIAWFLFLDGQPLADWRNVEELGDDLFLAPVKNLTPGFYRLDFYTILAHGDPPPALLMQRPGGRPGALPLHLLHSAETPEAVRIEYKGKATHVGLQVSDIHHVLLPQTEQECVVFSVADFSSGLPGSSAGPRFFVNDKETSLAGKRTFVVRGGRLPELKAIGAERQQMILPLQHAYAPLRLAKARIDVVGVPLLIGADRTADICIRATLDPWLRTGMGSPPELRVSQHATDGRELRQEPHALPAQDGDQTVRLGVAPGTSIIRIGCSAAGLPLAPERTVRIVKPGDSLSEIRAVGNQLLLDGDAVILSCEPIAELARVKLAPSADRRLVMLDDFCAVAAGIDATLLPEEALADSLGYAVERHDVPSEGGASAFPGLRKFSLLGKATAQPGDIACFAVGALDLKQGTRPLELCVHLLFLAQAASAHGVQPVLLTLPNMPGVPDAAAREAALYTKELGIELGVPVVDVYSKGLTTDGGPPGISRFLRDKTGTVGLSVPNDDGRRWLCDQVRQTLDQLARGDTE